MLDFDALLSVVLRAGITYLEVAKELVDRVGLLELMGEEELNFHNYNIMRFADEIYYIIIRDR